MLLSDPSIVELLEDDLVPSWESVHETAKVTIDFANGKSLQRTIGGNTVIYICRDDGAVVDAFPGVFTPTDFLAEAQPALELIRSGKAFTTDARLIGLHALALPVSATASHAIGKAAVESPMLLRLNAKGEYAPLHDQSKQPRPARSPRFVGSPKTIAPKQTAKQFGQSMVRSDSMNNRYTARPLVHAMLGKRQKPPTPSECTVPIYEGILGTDLCDPYLGLMDAEIPGTRGLIDK